MYGAATFSDDVEPAVVFELFALSILIDPSSPTPLPQRDKRR